MNISLTSELEGVVQTYIQNGMYGSQSEVVRAALRLLHEKDQEREARLDGLRKDVSKALEQVVSREAIPVTAQEFKARGRRRMDKLDAN